MHISNRLASFGGPLIALVALTGCVPSFPLIGGVLPPPSANEFIPGLPKGYQCPLVPSGFDPAGSIYRIDQSGTYFRVKDFSGDPAVTAAAGYRKNIPITDYTLSDKQTATAGLSLTLLKTSLPGLTASGSADLNKEVSVDVTVQDIAGEVIDDGVADYIVGWFKANIEPKPGNKYFLVRETVRAGAISFRLQSKDLAKLGGKSQVEKLAEGSANVTFHDNDGTFEIKQKFPERMPVCIKSAEIVSDNRSQPLAKSVSLKSTDETTVPAITNVGADWAPSVSH